jgi:hypothetical protein
MYRNAFILVLALALTACGLAETAATGAAAAQSQAEAARQGQKTEQQVQQRVEDAQRLDAEKRHAAEEASGAN